MVKSRPHGVRNAQQEPLVPRMFPQTRQSEEQFDDTVGARKGGFMAKNPNPFGGNRAPPFGAKTSAPAKGKAPPFVKGGGPAAFAKGQPAPGAKPNPFAKKGRPFAEGGLAGGAASGLTSGLQIGMAIGRAVGSDGRGSSIGQAADKENMRKKKLAGDVSEPKAVDEPAAEYRRGGKVSRKGGR